MDIMFYRKMRMIGWKKCMDYEVEVKNLEVDERKPGDRLSKDWQMWELEDAVYGK